MTFSIKILSGACPVSYTVQLDYSTLLGENDLQAFQDAMTFSLGASFPTLLTQLTVTLGLPTAPDPTQPLLTNVPLVSTNPAQQQPEYVSYMRMDLGVFLSCCQLYISQTDAASAVSVAAWLLSEHGLWFDPTTLTLGAIVADPTQSDRQLMTVAVASTNYVWTGSVTLYVVPLNHIALLAAPGCSKGLIQSDVMLI